MAEPVNSQASPELPDIASMPADLSTPGVVDTGPAPGLRMRATVAGWEDTMVYHTLYLPANWSQGGKFPIIVEYAGNLHENALGDKCTGTVEGSNLGYGLSAGIDYIWLCLPFVEVNGRIKSNTLTWWGDPDETTRYCEQAVRTTCRQFGGDESEIFLFGFSRGAIACNYIGLRDDKISRLWKAFLCHSHYDGVRAWPYAASNASSAKVRLARLDGRAQLISAEGSTADTRRYLGASGVTAPFTFADLPFRNHTDSWVLRDCDLRRKARAWLRGLTSLQPPAGIRHS